MKARELLGQFAGMAEVGKLFGYQVAYEQLSY